MSSGLADRTAWTTTAPPVTTTTTTVKTTTTSKQEKQLQANKKFATETIQAFFPPINLKMATSSNDGDVEEIDDIKHYLEVVNEDHSTTWGGRLHFKGLINAHSRLPWRPILLASRSDSLVRKEIGSKVGCIFLMAIWPEALLTQES